MLNEDDFRILKELRRDSRLTTRELGKLTKLSAATVHRRMTRLVGEGYIRQFTIIPDWKKVEKTMLAYILVNIDNQLLKRKNMRQDDMADILKKHPFIFDCATITGRNDVIMKVRAKDTNELNRFINWLRGIEGVLRTETVVTLYEALKDDNPFDNPEF
ncbi:MAG TPA: Lrp/AsnC family transcriptional regulator [Candidatus Nanoarchaeia archaeon]|nr:Lrp/AsnC family transcriptional regulator [Candidatus Nanoarchaeia archaeon]